MSGNYFGSHEFREREEDEVKTSSERSFGITFALFFAVVAALSWYHDGHRWPYYAGAGAVFAAVTFIAPRALVPLNKLWSRFGLLLHMAISPLILALLFYVFITPIGFLMRLTGKDPLRRRYEPAAKSYWIERDPPGPEPETFKNQF
jgi:asparagine N-glycosylation enzyme membrane subunit Stt3